MSSAPRPQVARLAGKLSLALVAAAALVCAASAQGVPSGYYDTIDTTSGATLRQTLHEVIDDHLWHPYTSSSTDTWDILNLAHEDPADSSRILDVYKNESYPKMGGGVGPYNREHTWPKSYGFPDLSTSNYPYTDCHMLFLCDASYNSSRSNKPFRTCNPSCSEKTTVFNEGQGGGSGVYPGNSNWTSGSFTQGTWETWPGRRGDVARAQLYADVRYEGGFHGFSGAAEPELILTDSEALIDASNTGDNEPVAYMGMLQTLLLWHAEDPVTESERLRNDIVGGFQGNRNPFVDHPEWVTCIFEGNCPPACSINTYCTAKVNSQGCLPQISFTGTPSLTGPDDFFVTATDVLNQQFGFMLWSLDENDLPFYGGTLCVAPPLNRTPIQYSGGSPGPSDCSGTFAYHVTQSFLAPFGEGAQLYAQYWYRDPGVFDLVGLSDGLAWTICP